MTTRPLRLAFTAILSACLALSACRPEPNHPPPPPPPPPLPVPVPIPAPDSPLPGTPPPSVTPEAPAPEAQAPRDATGPRTADVKSPEDAALLKQVAEREAAGGEREKAKSREGESLYDLAKEGKAKLPVSAPVPVAKVPVKTPPTPAPAKPEPVKPAPVAAAPQKPATKVTVPSTGHVHVDIPKGLQAYLDADPRMQPWSKQVIAVIDKCYASERKKNANAAGIIEVKVTMHENARPDADVKSLPPQLSGVVACATGGLMRTKMPLFTGKEGDRQTVRVHFEK